jgi:hypothetical protein
MTGMMRDPGWAGILSGKNTIVGYGFQPSLYAS